MKKAVIFYQSKTGTTEKYAQEIGNYLQKHQVKSECYPLEDYREELIQNTDYLFLGCWTKGLMVILQKPDAIWKKFAGKINIHKNTSVALFATYKLRVGSMFKNMKKHLRCYMKGSTPELRSKNGMLNDNDKSILDEFILDTL